MHTQNEEHVQLLQSMMGNDLDAEVARRVLAKHNNDIQAAASAILEGDRGEDLSTVSTINTWENFGNSPNINNTAAGGSGALNVPRSTPERGQPPTTSSSGEKDVIDLTAADHDPDLSRALQMSLEEAQPTGQTLEEPVFRRSERAPDPNWAMVPSNVPTQTAQEQEDQSLSRAIEASLNTSYIEDRYEDLPEEEKIRKPGHPVAMRTSMNVHYCSPLVFQALFHVPQVRERLARWRWEGNEKGLQPDLDSPDFLPYSMSSLFTYADHAVVSYIIIDNLDIVVNYNGRLATSAADLPGELSSELYSYLARGLERSLRTENSDRLFHLRYTSIDSPPPTESTQPSEPNALGIENCPPAYSKTGSDTSCVRVDLRGGPDGPNDLLSCLSSQLGLEPPVDSDSNAGTSATPNALGYNNQAQALVAPSEVIAFELIRPSHGPGTLVSSSSANANQQQNTSSSSSSSSTSSPVTSPFRYPMYVYLDQFLLENAAVAGEKRTKRREMRERLKELRAKKEGMTSFEGKPTLTSLSSSLYYFESVATKDGSETRAKEVGSAAAALQKIINRINTEVQVLDTQIAKLQVDIEKVFEDPALQKHRYDLRAVLVHDGLFGRSHIHSFVQHRGRWWKCQDASVVEVSEEVVLTDTTGLHLGAGPYMLIFSRQTEDVDVKSSWPTYLKNNAKRDNEDFLQTLEGMAPEAARSLRASYNPSPMIRPVDLSDEDLPGEVEDKSPGRSMSAMTIDG